VKHFIFLTPSLNYLFRDARARDRHYCFRGALGDRARASSLRTTTYQPIAGSKRTLIAGRPGLSSEGSAGFLSLRLNGAGRSFSGFTMSPASRPNRHLNFLIADVLPFFVLHFR
jgi:hypothetical protein